MEPRSAALPLQLDDYRLTPVQTTNLIINLDHDEWIFEDDSRILADLGLGEPPHLLAYNQLAHTAISMQKTSPKSASSTDKLMRNLSNTLMYV